MPEEDVQSLMETDCFPFDLVCLIPYLFPNNNVRQLSGRTCTNFCNVVTRTSLLMLHFGNCFLIHEYDLKRKLEREFREIHFHQVIQPFDYYGRIRAYGKGICIGSVWNDIVRVFRVDSEHSHEDH